MARKRKTPLPNGFMEETLVFVLNRRFDYNYANRNKITILRVLIQGEE